MPEPKDAGPIKAVQAAMRRAPIKRFYTKADVREADGLHALTLDGRPARTPGKRPLAARRRAVMERVADEWARQGETVDPSDMPLTRLLNSALDGVADTMEETRADIVRYAGSDLLCYRAEAPESLAERQRAAFDPVLDWAAEALGARFALAAGIVHVAQPAEAIEAVREAVDAVRRPGGAGGAQRHHHPDRFGRAGACGRARASAAEEAWRIAHVDEDFQIERWGEDEEALARRAARWREMEAAAVALAATRGS